MTDEELIKTLWNGEVTLGVVASAATRIQELLNQQTSIREAALREAAAECQTVLETAKLYGIPPMAMGAATCRETILALIEDKK